MPRRTDAIGPDNTLRPPAAAPRRPTSRTRLYALADAGSSSSLVGAGASAADPSDAAMRTRPALSPPDNMRRQREEAKKRKAQTKRRKDTASAAQSAPGPSGAGAEQERPSSRQTGRLETLAAAALLPQGAPAQPRRSRVRHTTGGGPAARSDAARDVPRTDARSSQPSSAPASDLSSVPGLMQQTTQAPESSAAARAAADAAAAAEIAAVAAEMASRPRTDIYSADFLGGVPGAEVLLDAEEDQPPPFPEGATRPLTPPGPPGTPEGPGGSWSARQLREQEEAEARRVPDSPPPPFRSDEESDDAEEQTSAALSAWEQDLRDGLSFDDRLRRELARRSAELGPASDGEDGAHSEPVSHDAEATAGSAESVGTPDLRQIHSPVTRRIEEAASDAAAASADVPVADATDPAAPPAAPHPSAAPQDIDEGAAMPPACDIAASEASFQPQDAPGVIAAVPDINLGALVMEARRRRALRASDELHEGQQQPSSASAAPASTAGPPGSAVSLASSSPHPQMGQIVSDASTTRDREDPLPARADLTGSATVRDPVPEALPEASRLSPHLPSPSPPTAARLPPRALPHAGQPQAQASRSARRQTQDPTKPALRPLPSNSSSARGGITRIRPRPPSESHSRFRDDAAAAAQRRSALWAGDRSTAGSHVLVKAPAMPAAASMEVRSSPKRVEEGASSASTTSTASQSEASDSDDSEAAWEEEHRALAALRGAERQPASPMSSADEASPFDRVPGGWRPSASEARQPDEPGSARRSKSRASDSRAAAAYASSAEETSDSLSSRDTSGLHDRADPPASGLAALSAGATGAVGSSDSSAQSIARVPKPDKGKAPVRPVDWLLSRSATEHPPRARSSSPARDQAQPEPGRAGTFVEFDGSSDSFASSSEDDPDRTVLDTRPRPLSSAVTDPPVFSQDRPAVNHRLKGLFATPLSASSTPEVAATHANDEIRTLRDARASRSPELEVSASRPAALPAALPPRPVQKTVAPHREHQLREEALTDISRLRSSASTRQDSLSALEALLQRGLGQGYAAPSSPNPTSARDEPTTPGSVTHSGISATPNIRPASFVNPRSSMAPRPLGRLPTITAATRHFAPSSQRGGNEARASALPLGNARDTELLDPIPAGERTALPAPLVPTRPSSNVSAMVSRFEGISPAIDQRPEGQTHSLQTSSDASSYADQDLDRRMSKLRRRPPPPPPRGAPPSRASAASALDSASHCSLATAMQHDDGASSKAKSPRTQTLDVLTDADARMPRSPFLPPEDASRVTASLAAGLAASSRRSAASAAGSSPRPLPGLPDARPESTRSVLSAAELSAARERGTLAGMSRRPARPLPVPPSAPSAASPLPTSAFASLLNGGIGQAAVAEPVPGDWTPVRADGPRANDATASDGGDARRDVVTGQARRSPTSTSEPSDRQSGNHGPVSRSSDSGLQEASRQGSVEFTDLDLLASRLELEGAHYDELAAIAEFIGPAKETRASAEDLANVGVGVVELLSRRVNKEGKVKQKLGVAGIRVEKCGICLAQFRDGQRACIFPCLHLFHEACATVLLRNARTCPACRQPIGAAS